MTTSTSKRRVWYVRRDRASAHLCEGTKTKCLAWLREQGLGREQRRGTSNHPQGPVRLGYIL